jgi:hypothetical protein
VPRSRSFDDKLDLVVVMGHAPRRSGAAPAGEHPGAELDDRWWHLADLQRGEGVLYVEHIRQGVLEIARDSRAMLLFSGGVTREENGPSEAETYRAVAESRRFWCPEPEPIPGVRERIRRAVELEEHARDSFENLFFGLLRFHELTGRAPRNVTLVGFRFKEARLELHRAALRWPRDRFRYLGVNDPVDLRTAEENEARTRAEFAKHRYGTAGGLADKRRARSRGGPYRFERRLESVVDALYAADPTRIWTGAFPWELEA